MNQGFKSLLLAALLSTGSIVSATEGTTYIEAGIGQYSYEDETITGYKLGLGGDTTYSNNVYLGFDFDVNSGEIYNEQIIGMGMDVNLGYTFINALSPYIFLGYNLQAVYDSDESQFDSYIGFGYGVGVNYKISNSFAVDAKYKMATLDYWDTADTGRSRDIDFSSIGVSLKYLF